MLKSQPSLVKRFLTIVLYYEREAMGQEKTALHWHPKACQRLFLRVPASDISICASTSPLSEEILMGPGRLRPLALLTFARLTLCVQITAFFLSASTSSTSAEL